MRGTDCTEAQIQSAREFLHARQAGSIEGLAIDDERVVSLPFGNMAKLLAWYGALRFKAGRDGTGGTLEAPGPMDERKGPRLCS